MPSTLDREIRAVVEIEAAQKILVGFAFAGMLGDDQPRHRLQRLAGAREGPGVHLRAADGHGAGGGGLHVCRPCGCGPRRHAAADRRRWNGRSLVERRMDFARFSRGAAAWLGCAAPLREDIWSPREAGRAQAVAAVLGVRRWTPWQTGMRRRKMSAKQPYATLMLPHDNCYSRRATASVRLDPALHASKRSMMIQ